MEPLEATVEEGPPATAGWRRAVFDALGDTPVVSSAEFDFDAFLLAMAARVESGLSSFLLLVLRARKLPNAERSRSRSPLG